MHISIAKTVSLMTILLSILLCNNHVQAMVQHRAPYANGLVTQIPHCTRVVDYRESQKSCRKHEDAQLEEAIQLVQPDKQTKWIMKNSTCFDQWFKNTHLVRCLEHAAKLPSTKKRKKIVAALLKKVSSVFIRKPSCLLADAIHNNYASIIQFINRYFHLEYVEWELIDAIRNNKPDRARVLLEAGINPNKGIRSETTEQVAVKLNDKQMKPLHITYGNNPLHLAVHLAHDKLVKLLLEHKADITIKAPDGRTPLGVVMVSIETGPNFSRYLRQLCILELIVDALPKDMQPKYNLSNFSRATRKAIKTILNKKHIPPTLSMEEGQDGSTTSRKAAAYCGCISFMTGLILHCCGQQERR